MKKFFNSVGFALRGIRFAWSGMNFRIQFAIGLLVIALGVLLGISVDDWLWIVTMIALVLSAEMFNSAIENIVNFISPDFHPLAGKIKDVAAGAVLILSIASIVIGLFIFVPYLKIFQ